MKRNIGSEFFEITNEISLLMTNFEFMHKKCTKLGRVECNLLHYLLDVNRQVNMKELARFLGVTHSRITHLMDSLIRKGFIDRIASKEDRRVFYAIITQNGKDIVNKHINESVKVYNKILPQLTEKEADDIIEALKVWKDFLNHLPKENDRY